MSQKNIDRRLCVAPMLDWTDRHERYFLRQISQQAVLYTEMITAPALLRGDAQRFLAYDECEHPLALQLGGSNPSELAACCKLAEEANYDEINLNVGCPSDRVQSGRFGACLMAEPELVADCIKAMQDSCSKDITVKHRLGIDDLDSYEFVSTFIDTVQKTGCSTFIVHARKAILKGLSPKENRQIPPLQYDRVYQLKKDFPDLEIIINGGIEDIKQSQTHLQYVDGVMIGRAAYHNPWMLSAADSDIYNLDNTPHNTREDIINKMIPYLEKELSQGTPLMSMIRHYLGLFHEQIGAKAWRRHISTHAHKTGSGIEVVYQAIEAMKQQQEWAQEKAQERAQNNNL